MRRAGHTAHFRDSVRADLRPLLVDEEAEEDEQRDLHEHDELAEAGLRLHELVRRGGALLCRRRVLEPAASHLRRGAGGRAGVGAHSGGREGCGRAVVTVDMLVHRCSAGDGVRCCCEAR